MPTEPLPTATSLPPTAAVKSVPILVPAGRFRGRQVNAGEVQA
jgi:hypothetical protein